MLKQLHIVGHVIADGGREHDINHADIGRNNRSSYETSEICGLLSITFAY